MKYLSPIAAAAVLAFASTAQAQSLPIVDGFTSVTLSAAPVLAGAGLSVGVLGSASASPGSDGIPLVYFPVTGGVLNTVTFAGVIEHDGSGLSLADATSTLNLTNFVIDTVALTLTGMASVNGTALGAVQVFDLGFSGNPFSPVSLQVSSAAAGALTAVFGVPDLTGVTLGTANTLPVTTVPEPATVVSMLAGLALMGALARRRRG